MDPLWNILEENMKQLAESSNAGWHPDETRLELFSLPQSHYIVAVSRVADDNAGIVEQPIAFIQFRFLVENEEIVCYMYELQSSREYRRCGIGRALHSILEQLCRHVKVKKIMLTVFLSNITALSFYYSLNYQRDPFSPLYVDEEESEDEEIDCDYDILSFIVPD
ncbi:putative acyl-CoA N-acyltransferase [Blattamonas nauphoetae]|uniref:N-alpha-acetyltransferase 40 n=1 Tax=Blattamonas nauphoetae TaxID=2049346 RepID=A0ABQ9Y4H4_9EUKA|nr:putative acyl-CoA N-acyltransferase [Blattamonas nauphoetae]